MFKVVKHGAKRLAKYGMVVKVKPKVEWTEPQVREAVKRQVLKVSEDPNKRKQQLVNLGDRLVDRQGRMDPNVAGTIMENFEPPVTNVKGKLSTHPRPVTTEMQGERFAVEKMNAAGKYIPEMNAPIRGTADIDVARKEFYDSQKEGIDRYRPSTKSQHGTVIEDAPVGSYGKDWATDPNSPVIGPTIPYFGQRKQLVKEKHVPVKTEVGYGNYVETIPLAEMTLWKEQAKAAWSYMGARSAGARFWNRMLENQAPKKILAGKDAKGNTVTVLKKDLMDKPRAGYNYYMLMFQRWKENPDTFGKTVKRNVGEKQRPVKKPPDHEVSARGQLEQMWENVMEGAVDGEIK